MVANRQPTHNDKPTPLHPQSPTSTGLLESLHNFVRRPRTLMVTSIAFVVVLSVIVWMAVQA